MRRALILSMLVTACGGGHGPSEGGDGGAGACGRAVATLDDCAHGYFYADCGGEGEPTFGCTGGKCVWFETACLPASYVASTCPASDRCCHGEPGATWAFESWQPEHYLVPATVEDVVALGSRPMSASAPGVAATVDPSAPSGSWALECPAGMELDVCAQPLSPSRFLRAGEALIAQLRSADTATEAVLVELVSQGGAPPLARAVVLFLEDAGTGAPATCEMAATRALDLQVESVVLTAFDLARPEDVHGRLDLVLGAERATFRF